MVEGHERLVAYLQNDDEREFLLRAYDREPGDAERLAHALKIEGVAPERAEWLRLEVALRAQASDDPAVRARFLELSDLVGPAYVDLLRRDAIRNCGSAAARAQDRRVRFAFQCPRRWETLEPTDSAEVRFCQECRENVYHCDSIDAAEERALAGQCIALHRSLVGGGPMEATVGRPDRVLNWAQYLFSLGPSRLTRAGTPYLLILPSAGKSTRSFTLDTPSVTIGRGAASALVLEGDTISDHHASLQRRADGWWVTAFDSPSGTFVNGEPIQEARLRDGDRILIGANLLRFFAP